MRQMVRLIQTQISSWALCTALTRLSSQPCDFWPRLSTNHDGRSPPLKVNCANEFGSESLRGRRVGTVNTFIEKRGASVEECIGCCGTLGPGSWGTFTPSHHVSKRKNCPRERTDGQTARRPAFTPCNLTVRTRFVQRRQTGEREEHRWH